MNLQLKTPLMIFPLLKSNKDVLEKDYVVFLLFKDAKDKNVVFLIVKNEIERRLCAAV